MVMPKMVPLWERLNCGVQMMLETVLSWKEEDLPLDVLWPNHCLPSVPLFPHLQNGQVGLGDC